MLKSLREEARPSCHFVFQPLPKSAAISVNGFDFGRRREFDFAPGYPYRIVFRAPGYQPVEKIESCRKNGTYISKARLKAETSRWMRDKLSLSQLVTSSMVDTLVLVESTRGELRFFLYTPELGIDEIPLQKPVRLAQVADNFSDRSLPILSDAFYSLFEKHRAWDLKYSPEIEPERSLSAEMPSEGKWYNNWKLWAIGGGVVGALIIAFAVSRSENIQSNTGH
jgi:hypothetical protein